MTVARESRRGGAQVASDSVSAAAAAQARSTEIQRQLNLTASEKKHFELVCEVKPDWNDSEIVSFLQKCNYNSNVINDALINAFEDLRPSEDQNAADWNVQSKKSKRKQKEKAATPGEQPSDRRWSGPRVRSERNEPRDRTEKPERRERSERRDRNDQPNYDHRPKRNSYKAEGTASKPQTEWASSSGNWGEAQSTMPAESGAWKSSTTPSDSGAWASSTPADSGGWAEPTTQPEANAETVVLTEPAPSKSPTSSSPSQAEGVPLATPQAEDKPKPSTSTMSWAALTKRSLSKPQSSSPTTSASESPKPAAADPEAKPATSGWGQQEEVVGQWGAPEPALAADAAPVAVDAVPEVPETQPELETLAAEAEPESQIPTSKTAAIVPPVEVTPIEPSTEDLLATSDPVILPQFVTQQVAGLNATMIKFGTISLDDESEMISPNAEFVRIHSAQADFHQQALHQEHEISDDVPDIRGRHDYEAMPMYAQYPPFLNNMPSYMPYDADTTSMPAYYEPYGQQQRVQRPRQQSYNNARNNKMRRDHRNAASNQRHQPEDFPAQPMAPNEQPNAFAQGMPERESQGPKQAGVERSNAGGPRGTKQRQSDRARGGLTGAYHHPSYAGGHIPVGYGQPYGYPAPYLPQFYGQNQQGYGPPGFRQHYSQYQSGSNYQQPYQSGIPRSAYVGQTEYVDSTGMHIGQHQGEPGPSSKQSETEHVSPDPSVLYPFEQQAWPDQHRYMLQQQQPHQTQNNESNVIETAPEGASIQHNAFDRRNDGSPSQQASFGYGGQQQYSQAHSYQNFSNQHQYNDSSNRSYPHWTSHQ